MFGPVEMVSRGRSDRDGSGRQRPVRGLTSGLWFLLAWSHAAPLYMGFLYDFSIWFFRGWDWCPYYWAFGTHITTTAISVGNDIPNSWVMWNIGTLKPTPVFLYGFSILLVVSWWLILLELNPIFSLRSYMGLSIVMGVAPRGWSL